MKADNSFKLLTLGFVKELCKEIGFSVNRNQCGELRVARYGATSGEGYFTTDLDDALSTAVAMKHANRN